MDFFAGEFFSNSSYFKVQEPFFHAALVLLLNGTTWTLTFLLNFLYHLVMLPDYSVALNMAEPKPLHIFKVLKSTFVC
jgi:hypothetical protein